MNILSLIIHKFANKLTHYSDFMEIKRIKESLGYIAKSSTFKLPDVCPCPEKIFIYENSSVYEHSSFIISHVGESGKFIMKRNSGAAQGLTVITNIHHRTVGEFVESNESMEKDSNKDIVVEEDVQIGANVTLLAGVKIGRGSSVAAGSVCGQRSTIFYCLWESGSSGRVLIYSIGDY